MPILLNALKVLVTVLATVLLLGSVGSVQADTTIRAGAVVDVEAGTVLKDRTITIKDGVIVAVAPSGSAPSPADGTLIDLSGHTVLPALIDAHTHLLSDSDDHGLSRLVVSLPEATINGVKNAATETGLPLGTFPESCPFDLEREVLAEDWLRRESNQD